MKQAATMLIVFAVISIAVFGFMAINHGQDHNGCLAATAMGADCPKENNLLGYIAFHLNALKSFSLAAEPAVTTSAFVALLVLMAWTFLRSSPTSRFNSDSPAVFNQFLYRQAPQSPPLLSEYKFDRWLALREKRNPAPSF